MKDTAYFAMQANTTGWVAIGYNPESKMLHADIVMGWVDADGKASVADMFSTGDMGPHAPDIEQKGKDNIHEFAGKELDGVTTIEFARKLDTEDALDQALVPKGETKIIWAYGSIDDDSQMHAMTARGSSIIVLDGAQLDQVASAGTTDPDGELEAGAERANWPIHAGLMFLGFIAVTSGAVTARNKKK